MKGREGEDGGIDIGPFFSERATASTFPYAELVERTNYLSESLISPRDETKRRPWTLLLRFPRFPRCRWSTFTGR